MTPNDEKMTRGPNDPVRLSRPPASGLPPADRHHRVRMRVAGSKTADSHRAVTSRLLLERPPVELGTDRSGRYSQSESREIRPAV